MRGRRILKHTPVVRGDIPTAMLLLRIWGGRRAPVSSRRGALERRALATMPNRVVAGIYIGSRSTLVAVVKAWHRSCAAPSEVMRADASTPGPLGINTPRSPKGPDFSRAT